MATLNGTRVRHRMGELALDFEALALATGIEVRTLHNTTRENKPDPMKLHRIGRLLAALNPPDFKRRGLKRLYLRDIVASGDGVPDDPPSKDQDDETNRGPGRDGSGGTGPGKGGDRKGPKRVQGAAA